MQDLSKLWDWHGKEDLYILRGLCEDSSLEAMSIEFQKRFNFYIDFIIENNFGEAMGVCSYYNVEWVNRLCEINLKIYEDKEPFSTTIDALLALKKFLCLNLNMRRIHAFVPFYLKQEIMVLEGINCTREGILRQHFYHNGMYGDLLVYGSMLN